MRNYLIFCFVALASTCSFAANIAPLALSEGKTGNFIFESDPKAMVSNIALVVRVGSIDDPKGKEGLMRLAYMALLRGTEKQSREEFVNELETLGANIDIDAGANRIIIKLAVINENLEPALKLMAAALFKPGFRESEMKGMLGEELAKLDAERADNRKLLKRTYRQALYGGTPLAFPPEGTPSSVKTIQIDDLKNAWQKTFVSGNLLWAVASNQDKNMISKTLERIFGQIPQGQATPRPTIAPNKLEGRTLYIVNRPGASTTETIIGHPSIRANDPARDTLETGMFIFGSDFTSRLPTVLRKQNGWTYGAYGSYHIIDLPRSYGGFFSIYTFPQTQFTEKAVPKAVELFEEYVKKGITSKELEFAKNSQGNSYAFHFATAKDRLLGRVYEALDGAPFTPVSEYRRKIKALTLKQILVAVQKEHNPKNLAIVVVGDAEKLKSLATLIPGIKSTKLVQDPMSAL